MRLVRPRPSMELPASAASLSRGDVRRPICPPGATPVIITPLRSGGACSACPPDASRRLSLYFARPPFFYANLRLPPNPCFAAGERSDPTGRPSHLGRPYLGAIGGICRALRNNAHVTARGREACSMWQADAARRVAPALYIAANFSRWGRVRDTAKPSAIQLGGRDLTGHRRAAGAPTFPAYISRAMWAYAASSATRPVKQCAAANRRHHAHPAGRAVWRTSSTRPRFVWMVIRGPHRAARNKYSRTPDLSGSCPVRRTYSGAMYGVRRALRINAQLSVRCSEAAAPPPFDRPMRRTAGRLSSTSPHFS